MWAWIVFLRPLGLRLVVRDKKVHEAVIEKICGLVNENKFSLLGLDFSPIKGPEGNIEYLCYIEKSDNPHTTCGVTASQIVELSHNQLDNFSKEGGL